jgi:hypothetical protein
MLIRVPWQNQLLTDICVYPCLSVVKLNDDFRFYPRKNKRQTSVLIRIPWQNQLLTDLC